MSDPVTGPIPRTEFAALVDAPFGAAAKAIRKHDPLWGVPDGKVIPWRVTCKGNLRGTAVVEAASEKQAKAEAANLSACEIDWDGDAFEVISLVPMPERT